MRILFLSKYYKNYLDLFDEAHPVGGDSYEQAYRLIIEDRYFWSDYFKQELPAYGYEVEQLIVDAKPLQTLWAEEHGCRFDPENWYFDIIFHQIGYYRPDLLFIQDWSRELGAGFIKSVRERFGFVRIVAGYCGESHSGADYFRQHDLVISCARDNVDMFRDAGLRSYHIYHAFYPGILDQLPQRSNIQRKPLGFIGRIVPASIHHRRRAYFLHRISMSLELAVHGEIQDNNEFYAYQPWARKVYSGCRWLCPLIEKYDLQNYHRVLQSCLRFQQEKALQDILDDLSVLVKDQRVGLAMFDLLRDYSMLLNYHISPVNAANLRLFEVTGVGSCLVTDWKENLTELFEPDYEVVTYKNVDEAIDKINYLIDNPQKADEIARAGQKRTLKDHTYQKRAHDMHEIFQEYRKAYA